MREGDEASDRGWQGPTNGLTASTIHDLWACVTHPAFRLGFLDAQAGRPLDHDCIEVRVRAETPPNAWKRMQVDPDWLLRPEAIARAQFRYEEGRLAVLMVGLRCRAWGHPDLPPASVREYISSRAKASAPDLGIQDFSIADMHISTLPLFQQEAK